MKKYLRAPSTWIILSLALIISFVVGGYLPFGAFDTNKGYQYYGYSVLLSTGVITSMLSVFSSIFAGFKAATMFRDEIESGTFLVMLSKPLSRGRIIMQKWFALQTMMIMFAALNIFAYEISIAAFDNYKSFPNLSSVGVKPLLPNIVSVGGYLFLCIFVVGLIFSSIALLISTKMSSASTIGISIAIGVIIPITAMVGMFTQKPTYDKKKNDTIGWLGSTFINTMKDVAQTNGGPLSDTEKNQFNTEFNKLHSLIEDPTRGIYNIGVDLQEGDRFNKYWPTDFSYQLTAIGSLSTEKIITTDYKDSLVTLGVPSQMVPKVKTIRDSRDPLVGKTVEQAEKIVFDNLVRTTSEVYNIGKMMEKMLIDRKTAFVSTDGDDKGKVFAYNEHEANLVSLVESLIRRPVNMIINKGHMASAVSDAWTLTQSDKYSYDNFNLEVNKVVGPVSGTRYKVTEDEKETYNDLMNVVHNNLKHFGYIKTVDYVNRRTLLWVYIALAILLVPISLLIMRKKDFR